MIAMSLPRLLPAFAAALLLFSALPAGAASPSEPDDETLRSACVMVKAHIIRPGAPPVASATGTGFFVAPNLILTCNHCTRIPMPHGMVNANDVQVELDGGTFVRARVVDRDPAHDLALLEIDTPSGSNSRSRALSLSPRFSLRSGSAITIVGNFPEAIRVTRGELVARSVMRGFAMGSAKVRSGFSGGPVLDENGAVQGILSQRDDDHNSIFVRADVIRNLLSRHDVPPVPLRRDEAPAAASSDISVASSGSARNETRQTAAARTSTSRTEKAPKAEESRTRETATSAEPAKSAPAARDEAVVVALPVRPASVTEVAEKAR